MAEILAPRNAGEAEQRARFEKRVALARPSLMARALRSLPVAADAEDAVQETLTIALTKSEWRDVILPENWVHGILSQIILAKISRIRHKTRPASLGDVDAVTMAGAGYHPCDVALEEIAAAQEMTHQIRLIKRAMTEADLSDKERAALHAKLTGQTNAQIAAMLDIKANAVRAYLCTAQRKTRAALSRLCAVPV